MTVCGVGDAGIVRVVRTGVSVTTKVVGFGRAGRMMVVTKGVGADIVDVTGTALGITEVGLTRTTEFAGETVVIVVLLVRGDKLVKVWTIVCWTGTLVTNRTIVVMVRLAGVDVGDAVMTGFPKFVDGDAVKLPVTVTVAT